MADSIRSLFSRLLLHRDTALMQTRSHRCSPFCDHTEILIDSHTSASSSRDVVCESAYTSLEPDSLLLAYGPPISDDLCSVNYSPRFPPGHYLYPAFARAYLLGDELGSGGYGFVMTALHRRRKSEVAVKLVIKEKVPEQAWVNHDTLGKIPMEIMLLRIMNHDNIVKCLDVFEDDLFFYVVSLRVSCSC